MKHPRCKKDTHVIYGTELDFYCHEDHCRCRICNTFYIQVKEKKPE